MQTAVWEHRVLLFLIVCHGVLLWRLWSQKLAGVYLFLTIFLVGETLQDLAGFPIPQNSRLYAWLFVYSSPVLWLFAYFVVLELYRLILEDYPGIASVGRKAVSWCMGLALVVSILYALPDLKGAPGGPSPILRIYFVAERSTVLGLLLFLVLIQVFLLHYRLRLSRNRMVYATGYALYFGVVVAQDVILTALGIQTAGTAGTVGLWTTVLAGVILLAGAALLSSQGEARVQLESVDSGSDRARLQQQLTDMNRLLSRAARGRG
jgi:hypothetical protein